MTKHLSSGIKIKTGVEGKNVAFLFTDTQIVVETMLEDLNNVLNSGEIPNLFPQDEQVRLRLFQFAFANNMRAAKLSPVQVYAISPAV